MKYQVEVVQLVEVEIDETKFTEEFMEEFRQSFYQFYDIDEHVQHLAYMYTRGIDHDCTEGYGPIEDFGIKFQTLDQWEEIQ